MPASTSTLRFASRTRSARHASVMRWRSSGRAGRRVLAHERSLLVGGAGVVLVVAARVPEVRDAVVARDLLLLHRARPIAEAALHEIPAVLLALEHALLVGGAHEIVDEVAR